LFNPGALSDILHFTLHGQVQTIQDQD